MKNKSDSITRLFECTLDASLCWSWL